MSFSERFCGFIFMWEFILWIFRSKLNTSFRKKLDTQSGVCRTLISLGRIPGTHTLIPQIHKPDGHEKPAERNIPYFWEPQETRCPEAAFPVQPHCMSLSEYRVSTAFVCENTLAAAYGFKSDFFCLSQAGFLPDP